MHDPRTRILIVVSNLEYGGTQRQIVELANNLDPVRYLVHVASLSHYAPLKRQISAKVPVHVLHKRFRFDPGIVVALVRLINRYRYQILHSFLFDAEIAVRLARLCSSQTVKVIGSERSLDYRLKTVQLLANRCTRHLVDRVIANSTCGAAFNRRVLGMRRDSYRVVYNGVDSARFRPRDLHAMRRRLELPAGIRLVGVFASFKIQKNHLFLLDAVLKICERHPELRILLVGDMLHAGVQGSDNYRSAVISRIKATKLKHLCIVAGNRDDVELLYPACDATVLPSRAEGLPNAVLESMACGVPVIATRVSDNDRIVINGQTGFIVDHDDRNGLACAMHHMLVDKEHRAAMGRNARARVVASFSSRQLALNTAQVYEELVHHGPVHAGASTCSV